MSTEAGHKKTRMEPENNDRRTRDIKVTDTGSHRGACASMHKLTATGAATSLPSRHEGSATRNTLHGDCRVLERPGTYESNRLGSSWLPWISRKTRRDEHHKQHNKDHLWCGTSVWCGAAFSKLVELVEEGFFVRAERWRIILHRFGIVVEIRGVAATLHPRDERRLHLSDASMSRARGQPGGYRHKQLVQPLTFDCGLLQTSSSFCFDATIYTDQAGTKEGFFTPTQLGDESLLCKARTGSRRMASEQVCLPSHPTPHEGGGATSPNC